MNVDVSAIDHLNLRIPSDGVEAATAFYGDRLGFEIEGLSQYRESELSFFDVRLTPEHVIHLWPTSTFDPPTGENFDHVAVVVETDVETLRDRLTDAGIEPVNEKSAPLGATGRAPAVYVEDPFGYVLELKTPVDSAGEGGEGERERKPK